MACVKLPAGSSAATSTPCRWRRRENAVRLRARRHETNDVWSKARTNDFPRKSSSPTPPTRDGPRFPLPVPNSAINNIGHGTDTARERKAGVNRSLDFTGCPAGRAGLGYSLLIGSIGRFGGLPQLVFPRGMYLLPLRATGVWGTLSSKLREFQKPVAGVIRRCVCEATRTSSFYKSIMLCKYKSIMSWRKHREMVA